MCRLLRVHSTGLTSRADENRRSSFLEQHPQLQPGQVGAQAVVHAVAETQVRVGFTRDVEGIGICEHQRVPVGRAFPDLHLLPGLDVAAAQRHRSGRGAPLGR